MHRTQIYFDENVERILAQMASDQGVSKSALIREAVEMLIKERHYAKRQNILASIYGAWKDIPPSELKENAKSFRKDRMERLYGPSKKL